MANNRKRKAPKQVPNLTNNPLDQEQNKADESTVPPEGNGDGTDTEVLDIEHRFDEYERLISDLPSVADVLPEYEADLIEAVDDANTFAGPIGIEKDLCRVLEIDEPLTEPTSQAIRVAYKEGFNFGFRHGLADVVGSIEQSGYELLPPAEEDQRDPVQAFHEDLGELIGKHIGDRVFPTESAMELISQTLHGIPAFEQAGGIDLPNTSAFASPEYVDPVVRYFIGVSLGAVLKIASGWSAMTKTARGFEYYAELNEGKLKVRRTAESYAQRNLEEAVKKAAEAHGKAKAAFDDISLQVEQTYEAKRQAENELERATVQKKQAAETVLQSWVLTLEEIEPRKESALAALQAAESVLKLANEALADFSPDTKIFEYDFSEYIQD